MSKQLINFQPDHQELLKRFLSFFNLKKEQCNKQVHIAIEDVRDECLKSSIFTRTDLEKTFERLQQEMETTVRAELEMFYRMSGVFIQMLMYDAEQQNSTLKADVNYMENYKALEDIKDFEKLSLSGQSFSLQKKATITSKLPTLGSTQIDPTLVNENNELKMENERVKKMIQQLQEKLAQSLSNKTQLSDMVEGHKKLSEDQVEELRDKIQSLQEEKQKFQDISENLRKETQNTKQELQKKVNQLTQVTNMKKMIQDKNSKIKELRDRLGKYETVEEEES